jgi:hypothetical protein
MEFTAGLNPGSKPYELVEGPDGNLWFTDDGSTPAIGRITPSGTIMEIGAGLNQGSVPSQMVSGPEAGMWFTDEGSTKAIGRITTSATPSKTPMPVSPANPTMATPNMCSVALASARITARGAAGVAIRLTATGTGTCRGKLTMTVKRKDRGKQRRSRRSKRQTIGMATFSIPPGKSATVELKLNAAGRALLKAGHGRLSARLRILKLSPAPSQTHSDGVHLVQRRAHE